MGVICEGGCRLRPSAGVHAATDPVGRAGFEEQDDQVVAWQKEREIRPAAATLLPAAAGRVGERLWIYAALDCR